MTDSRPEQLTSIAAPGFTLPDEAWQIEFKVAGRHCGGWIDVKGKNHEEIAMMLKVVLQDALEKYAQARKEDLV